MGNKMYKECIENKESDILQKFNDKILKLRSSSPDEIDESEYNRLLHKPHVLIDNSVDTLKNTFSNNKEKLCELLNTTRCLVNRETQPQIKYAKRCLEKIDDLYKVEIDAKLKLFDNYYKFKKTKSKGKSKGRSKRSKKLYQTK